MESRRRKQVKVYALFTSNWSKVQAWERTSRALHVTVTNAEITESGWFSLSLAGFRNVFIFFNWKYWRTLLSTALYIYACCAGLPSDWFTKYETWFRCNSLQTFELGHQCSSDFHQWKPERREVQSSSLVEEWCPTWIYSFSTSTQLQRISGILSRCQVIKSALCLEKTQFSLYFVSKKIFINYILKVL